MRINGVSAVGRPRDASAHPPPGFEFGAAVVTAAVRGDHDLTVELAVPEELWCLRGHFDGLPVVPGVVQLLWVVTWTSDWLGRAITPREVVALKFKQLLTPRERFRLRLEREAGADGAVRFQLANERAEFCSGRIVPALPGSEPAFPRDPRTLAAMSDPVGGPASRPLARRGPFPAMRDLLPHRPPMVLVDAVTFHDARATTCAVRIGPRSAFADAHGHVPIVVALEYMAQTVGVHSGLCRRAVGEPIRLGFLLGSRRLELHAHSFMPGQELEVRARDVWNDAEFASFECEVADVTSGALLASGALSVFSPADPGVLALEPRP